MPYRDTIKRRQLGRTLATVAKVVTGSLDTIPAGKIGGVDTDLYAGPFSFEQLVAQGGRFAYVRAGQNAWVDPQFHNSWMQSKGLVKRGLYWFLDKSASINAQARLLCSMLPNGYDGDLPLALDLEQETQIRQKDGTKVHLTWSDAVSFVQVLKQGWPSWDGQYVIYTGWSWWTTNGTTDPEVASHPLWFASPGYMNPRIPKPWTQASILQISFSGNGPLYGTLPSPGHLASRGIDLDVATSEFASQYNL